MENLLLYNNLSSKDYSKSFIFLRSSCLKFIKNYTFSYPQLDAEDIFNESFLKLIEKIQKSGLEHSQNVRAYFMVICKNTILAQVNRRKIIYIEDYKHDKSHPRTSENQLENELFELEYFVDQAIDKLPVSLKNVSVTLFKEQMNAKETSEKLDMDYELVRKYKFKAVKKLVKSIPIEFLNSQPAA